MSCRRSSQTFTDHDIETIVPYFIAPVYSNRSCVRHSNATKCPVVEDGLAARKAANGSSCVIESECEVLFIALSLSRITTTTGACSGGSGGLCAYKSKWTCGGNRQGNPLQDDCGPRSLCEHTLTPRMAGAPAQGGGQVVAGTPMAACYDHFYQIGDSEEEASGQFGAACIVFGSGAGFVVLCLLFGACFPKCGEDDTSC